MMRLILYFVITFWLYVIAMSLFCSCKTGEKKLDRLVKKYPELMTKDTIVFRDTIIVESHRNDTVTVFRHSDTVTVINNDKVLLRYVYDTLTNHIYHEVECRGDTVFFEKTIVRDKITINKPTWKDNVFSLWWFWLALFLFVLFKAFRKHLSI